MELSSIIKSPILTEKSHNLMESNVYTFKVDKRAHKLEIAKAVEFIFNVKVERVNTINIDKKPKKLGRFAGFKSAYKKAIVFLADGYTINIFPEEAEEETKKSKTVKAEVVSEDKAAAAQAKAAAKLAKKANKSNEDK